ncbi:winged helix-turn-helix domain-containing protein, partial [Streptomyces sp. MBT57]|nr:winged helix-turn-helix domain-containing protein [Streptomyces sp. MBT57]
RHEGRRPQDQGREDGLPSYRAGTGGQVRIDLLGPVSARRGAVPLALGPVRRQAVLAALILRAPAFVTYRQLLDDVWGAETPGTGHRVLSSYVYSLRKALDVTGAGAARSVIRGGHGGYRLVPEGVSTDLGDLAEQVGRIHRAKAAGDLDTALVGSGRALELFRGEPLPGLPGPLAGTERERLAREIHDTLAQGLSSIQLLLRAAERTLPDQAPATAHVRAAREAAQANLAEARSFVRALTPPDLEHGSLAAALERLCARTTAPGLTVRFAVSGTPVELPTPYEVALLRTAQSALANTVRHAGAGRAEITLSFMDTSVALDVVDDGRGFDPSGAPVDERGDGGFGLPAMRSRAATLGGTLSVESAPGQGTALAVTLPVTVPAQDGERAA